MSLREALLVLLREAEAEEMQYISTLTEAERSPTRDHQEWTAKDVMGHIAVWVGNIADGIESDRLSDDSPLYDGTLEEANEAFIAEYAGKSWGAIMDELEASNARLQAHTAWLSDELLRDGKAAWLPEWPLWRTIGHLAGYHSLWHLTEQYQKRRDWERAVALIEKATRLILDLTDEDRWQALYAYNLACSLANSGRKEKAIEQLRMAFPLRPDLANYSRTDADLELLWEDEAYQRLAGEYGPG